MLQIEVVAIGAGVTSARVDYLPVIKYDAEGHAITSEGTYTVKVKGQVNFDFSTTVVDGNIFLPTIYTTDYFNMLAPEATPTLTPTDLWKDWPYPVTGTLGFATWYEQASYTLGGNTIGDGSNILAKDVQFATAWSYLPFFALYLKSVKISQPTALAFPYDLNTAFNINPAFGNYLTPSRAYGFATATQPISELYIWFNQGAPYGSTLDKQRNFDYWRMIDTYHLVKHTPTSGLYKVPTDLLGPPDSHPTGLGWRLLDATRTNPTNIGGDGSNQWIGNIFHNTVPYGNGSNIGRYGTIRVDIGYLDSYDRYEIDWYELPDGRSVSPQVYFPRNVGRQTYGYNTNDCHIYTIYSFDVKTDELCGIIINGQGANGTYGNEPLIVFPPNDGAWHSYTGKVPATTQFSLSWYYRQFPVANGCRYSIRNLKFGSTNV